MDDAVSIADDDTLLDEPVIVIGPYELVSTSYVSDQHEHDLLFGAYALNDHSDSGASE